MEVGCPKCTFLCRRDVQSCEMCGASLHNSTFFASATTTQAYSQVLMVGGGGRWECSNNGRAAGGGDTGEGSLYTTLKALRKQQADVLQQPAFCVFGNAVLDEIVLQRPTSMQALRSIKVSGMCLDRPPPPPPSPFQEVSSVARVV